MQYAVKLNIFLKGKTGSAVSIKQSVVSIHAHAASAYHVGGQGHCEGYSQCQFLGDRSPYIYSAIVLDHQLSYNQATMNAIVHASALGILWLCILC